MSLLTSFNQSCVCRYDGRGPSAVLPHRPDPTVLCAGDFGDDGLLRIVGRRATTKAFPSSGQARPCPSLFWAAGYSFSRSSLITEVPYSPHLPGLFLGEEMHMLARMWTRGWDVYAPPAAVVFHMWERSERPHTFAPDVAQRDASRRRVRRLLSGEAAEAAGVVGDGECFDVGSVRSMEAFRTHLDVDFTTRRVGARAKLGGLPSTAFVDGESLTSNSG